MNPETPDRRHFLRIALAGGAAGLAATPAEAQELKPDDAEATDVEARMAWIVARHGDKLDDEARKSVRNDVESLVKRARRLREFPLTNADGPFLILSPYRAPAE